MKGIFNYLFIYLHMFKQDSHFSENFGCGYFGCGSTRPILLLQHTTKKCNEQYNIRCWHINNGRRKFYYEMDEEGVYKMLAEEVRLIQAFLVGNGSHYKGATMNTRIPVIQVEQGTFTELFLWLQVINYVQRTYFNLVVKLQLLCLIHLKLITILHFSVVIHFTTSARVSDLQEPIIFLFQLVVMTILPIFIAPCTACYPNSRLTRK